jgi:curved DNA-binding protein CbpA
VQRNLWDQVDANLYDVLGISPDASQDDIVTGWRTAAKRSHPDLGGDANAFQQAEVAYEVLSDPLERNRYDRYLAQRTSGYQQPTGSSPYSAPGTRGASNATSAPGYAYATYDPRTGGYTYSTIYFTARPTHSAQPPNAPRRKISPWTWFVIVVVALVCIFAAVALTIVSPIIFVALLIWLVGRSLNPRGSRDR